MRGSPRPLGAGRCIVWRREASERGLCNDLGGTGVRILPGEQGTEQWRANRRGLPTSSQFHRILSPGRLELSAQAEMYRNELVAERLLGVDIAADATAWMERGQIMEAEAISFYEFTRDV